MEGSVVLINGIVDPILELREARVLDDKRVYLAAGECRYLIIYYNDIMILLLDSHMAV